MFRNNSFMNRGQNVPRGTFSPNQGAFPQNPQNMPSMPNMHGSHNMQGNMQAPYPPQNMGRHMPQPQRPMHQMPPQHMAPQMPQQGQQMPPMSALNPQNDPHVRFEPVPANMQPATQGTAPTPPPPQISRPHELQAPPAQQPAPANVQIPEGLQIKLSDFMQGESNGMRFYEGLTKLTGISERERQLVAELLESKKKQMQKASLLHLNLAKSEWAAKDMTTESASNFRGGISYALLQESRLLREASGIYESLVEASPLKGAALAVVHGKIADIAHLMSL